MSWMPPELAEPPWEKKIKCDDCESWSYPDNFTKDTESFEKVCDDCYEEVSDCCGAEISDSGLCYECREHV